jgi:hypothetical protein
MREFPLAAREAAADLAQGVRSSQLVEQHGHKLAPAREPAGVTLSLRRNDRFLKLRAGKKLE